MKPFELVCVDLDTFIENLNNACICPGHRNVCAICGLHSTVAYEFKSGKVVCFCTKHEREGTWRCREIEMAALSNKVEN